MNGNVTQFESSVVESGARVQDTNNLPFANTLSVMIFLGLAGVILKGYCLKESKQKGVKKVFTYLMVLSAAIFGYMSMVKG